MTAHATLHLLKNDAVAELNDAIQILRVTEPLIQSPMEVERSLLGVEAAIFRALDKLERRKP